MPDLRDLVIRWLRGWRVARALPAAEEVDGGLRVRCMQPGRDVEYVALDPALLPRLADLVVGEDAVTWLTVATTDPAAVVAAVEAAGLVVLKSSEQLMTADLDGRPPSVPAPYRLAVDVDDRVVTATVRDESGQVAARGTMGLAGRDAIADRIETAPAHRRKGLASVVMGALAASAVEQGADRGVLIASEEGQWLYASLGWQPVAQVVIATTPGNTYPS
ncbi:GNAT family N-acetyltransferase [Asanoa sp. WMMD1127]|uniref:GNAT family N-acetyltransferase n=1 Tax=Asanoa sp. WMMD1127 TaxID=3016107 RepID=UPI0024170EB4|nr:GNAT family N-acetyltransferase [Asanoa sp. WMMD1127]MDG4827522.1 GNAT family N-acetyltransferase [Asanoa sp. WMMD1127]